VDRCVEANESDVSPRRAAVTSCRSLYPNAHRKLGLCTVLHTNHARTTQPYEMLRSENIAGLVWKVHPKGRCNLGRFGVVVVDQKITDDWVR
jgi:hypothetical protein